MINHVRTLLMNSTGTTDPAYPGEEYVPAYTPIIVPPAFKPIWEILFGYNPDRAMLNYRLHQYMNLIHGTRDLEEFVTTLDSRITYTPFNNNSIYDNIVVPATATQLNTPIKTVDFVGDLNNQLAVSRLINEWIVTVLDSSSVKIQQVVDPKTTITSAYTASGGLSSVVNMPGTTLGIRFQEGVGSSWMVRLYCRPSKSLATVISELQSSSFMSALFTSNDEPYKTFENLWLSRTEQAYKLGGVVLALAYNLNELIGS